MDNNGIVRVPGKHTKSEYQLTVMALEAASTISHTPITKENIETVRGLLDKMDRLFDAAVGETERGEWAV